MSYALIACAAVVASGCGPNNREAGLLVLLVWPLAILLSLLPQLVLVRLWRPLRPKIERKSTRVLQLAAVAGVVALLLFRMRHANEEYLLLALWFFGTSYATLVLLGTRLAIAFRRESHALFAPQLIVSLAYAPLAALMHAGAFDACGKGMQDLFAFPGYMGWTTGGLFLVGCVEGIMRRRRVALATNR